MDPRVAQSSPTMPVGHQPDHAARSLLGSPKDERGRESSEKDFKKKANVVHRFFEHLFLLNSYNFSTRNFPASDFVLLLLFPGGSFAVPNRC